MCNTFDIDFNTLIDYHTDESFSEIALQCFHYQYNNNQAYRQYCDLINCDIPNIKNILQIPFLPISFYRSHKIISGNPNIETIFQSSSTTSEVPSMHYVADLLLYKDSILKGFGRALGSITDYAVISVLPSYVERKAASLVYMADYLIKESKNPCSGFYKPDKELFTKHIPKAAKQSQRVLLLGVSFALWDLAEKFPQTLPDNLIMMETGGMKGRRPEITREELHRILCSAFSLSEIYSEYGMTEMLSQAYSTGSGIFQTPHWMKVLVRDIYDPFSYMAIGKSGAINIIDFANIHSCCFLETSDIGKLHEAGHFEVSGRLDNSQIRGCNLMFQ